MPASSSMQRSFRRFPTSDGIRFELPRRELGAFSRFGWFLLAFCAFASLFLIVWSAIWLLVGISFVIDGQIWGLGVAAISLIGFAGLYQALKFGMLGWYLIGSKTECHVEISPRFLISNERLGLFNWRRKCESDTIKRLGIESSRAGERSSEELNLDINLNLMTIRARTDKKSFLVAPGYPHKILAPLLMEIAAELNRTRGETEPIEFSTDVHEPASELAEDSSLATKGPEAAGQLAEVAVVQPADSRIEIHENAGSRAYQVLPTGIRKGSKGLLGFSIVWNLSMLISTTIFVIIVATEDLMKGWGWLGVLMFALFAGIFWLVGILSLVSAINAGRRSAMLGVADGQLFIERKSIFGTKWIELPVEDINKIRVGSSGTVINSVPVLELQIHQADGQKHGLLSQLGNDDLYWLAWELSNSLESARP